ncbi:hypothetical protein [Sphingobium phenoxybenzoativorans]|uniref:hypothetical protein n=1 Tax=Sphingobium phenoxybenzoativorans TaxID=1592790 RepID=UPI0008732BBB|nr:hypothetical protein [Sphingobium phenoxybenzoativorans]
MPDGAPGGWRRIASSPAPILAAILGSAIPILSVAHPPVLDYPNHLARIWLLSGKVNEAPLSAMYAADWSQASTNIAVDFVASSLARIMPIGALNLLLLLAMFLGPPVAAILLNRALCRTWHIWQAATLFLAWSTTAIAGFLNFQIGLAAALICAALLLQTVVAPAKRMFALHLASAALLLLIHPFALLFYAALGSGLALGDRPAMPRSVRDLALPGRKVAVLALACIAPLAALFLFAPTPPGVHANGTSAILWSSPSKMIDPLRIGKALASPILTYRAMTDILFFLPLAICLGWAVASRRVRFHGGLLIAGIALAALACIAPEEVGDASWIQRRLPPMAFLTFAAAIMPVQRQRVRADIIIAAVIAATVLLRIAWVERVWTDRQGDFTQLGEAARRIPPGAAVIVVRPDWTSAAQFPLGRLIAGSPGAPIETGRHAIAPFAVQRGFFIPTHFTVPGQQPLSVRPAWRSRSVYVTSIPYASHLGTRNLKEPYVRNWRADFDYLLVINADMGELPARVISHVTPLTGQGFARLYRIRK